MKIKIIILLALFLSLNAQDYSKLNEYKQTQGLSTKIKDENIDKIKEVQLRFLDINNFDFTEFEKKYGFSFKYCIADGICIFEYHGDDEMAYIINNITKNEKAIKEIKILKILKMKEY